MELREARTDDLERVLHHRREMFREMGGDYLRDVDEFEAASRAYFEAALKDGTYYGLFGEAEGEVIAGGGVVIVDWPGSPLNFDARRAWIMNIYVEPGHRRRGHAQVITKALVAWCRSNRFRSVALHASLEGRPVYEKLGFRPTNEMRLRFE